MDSATLLRALGGGIRPLGLSAAGSSAARAPATGAGGLDFARLLSQAQAGEVASMSPVSIERGAGVSLSDDQLRRLSIAADRAEASGVSRALVLIDGMALRLDVGARSVVGKVELSAGAALSGIDGVVRAPETAGMDAGASVEADASSTHDALLRALSRSRTVPAGAGS